MRSLGAVERRGDKVSALVLGDGLVGSHGGVATCSDYFLQLGEHLGCFIVSN